MNQGAICRVAAWSNPMRCKRILLVLVISFALGGCASTYTLPSNTQSLASLMSSEQALAILNDALTADERHAGLCSYRDLTLGISLSGSPATFTKINQGWIDFTSAVTIPSATPRSIYNPQGPRLDAIYSNPNAPHVLEFNKIDLIRLMGDKACGQKPGGYAIRLESGIWGSVLVHVDEARFERFSAALRYLLPMARWIDGMGF